MAPAKKSDSKSTEAKKAPAAKKKAVVKKPTAKKAAPRTPKTKETPAKKPSTRKKTIVTVKPSEGTRLLTRKLEGGAGGKVRTAEHARRERQASTGKKARKATTKRPRSKKA